MTLENPVLCSCFLSFYFCVCLNTDNVSSNVVVVVVPILLVIVLIISAVVLGLWLYRRKMCPKKCHKSKYIGNA